MIMKSISFVFFPIIMIGLFSSCGNKKDTHEIIAKKPVIVKSNNVLKMGDYSQSTTVQWVGSSYKVNVKLCADSSLPTVIDGSQKYFDNKITLQVLRKDGSEFFSRTFTKQDFESCLDSKYMNNGALLGIVYDCAKGDCLYFAASVGSPDKTSDEYIPMVLKLSKMGSVSISKDTQLDTGSDIIHSEDTKSEDEGI